MFDFKKNKAKDSEDINLGENKTSPKKSSSHLAQNNISTPSKYVNDFNRNTFLQEQLDFLKEVYEGNKTWKELRDFRATYGYDPDINVDSVRRSAGLMRDYVNNGWVHYPEGENPLTNREVIETNYVTNITTSDRVISINSFNINNQDELLKAHGFNPKEFFLVSAKNSKWEQGRKDDNKTLYSSKITVKPIIETPEITFEDVDNYFKNYKGSPGLKIHPTNYDENGDFLEVCVQDLHIGLLSYGKETGEDYNVEIAKEYLNNTISDVVERCKNRKFKRILFVSLGDILHVDNQQNTTTKGTRQDVDTRVTKMFDEALNLMINCVKTLGEIAPVEVINTVGNHSQTLDYCLFKALECAYKNDENVKFFISPNPRKWNRYGNVLIGWAHGDMKAKNVTEWIQSEASKDWGLTKYRECHMGHLHSTQTLQKIEDSMSGLIVRYLPTLCASSAWEHHEGYSKHPKTLISFVWNEDKGLREMWYSGV